ncbi:MAG: polyprenyl synthetase family protein [Candidatus Adiutrix sp.]|jgi:octaprenyl-diphosphate synthase|nr:polyprenyl synthetase family protein [Candidatus Adiutrix sp.]
MAEIMDILAPLIKNINQTMIDLIGRDEAAVARVSGYSFDGGGKRLRPLMFCLVSEALGRPLNRPCLEIAASFEFLHMATLLHDDIVDVAEVRRGRAAAHLVFGTPEAVLAGDYLLSKAAALGAATGNLKCVQVMSRVAGTLSLGELVQLGSRRQVELSESAYFQIIYRKTAVLMEGAARIAALLAGADGREEAAARRYGLQFGLAFQIMDDILDYQGDEATFGKPVGHDLDEGKITLPFIKAREALDDRKRARLCELAERDSLSPQDHEEIQALVLAGGGVNSAHLKADELAHEAMEALSQFQPSPARDKLEALAALAAARSY